MHDYDMWRTLEQIHEPKFVSNYILLYNIGNFIIWKKVAIF